MKIFCINKQNIITILIILVISSICIPTYAASKVQLTLMETSKKITVGDTTKIKIKSVSSGASLLYGTNNTKVVKIVNQRGEIQAVGAGTAEIMVQASNMTGTSRAYARCKITVLPKVNKVTLNTTSKSMKKNDTVQLKVTLSPSNAINTVTWKSSNTSVAKVNSSGKVTAVGQGKATITVTSTKDSSKKATCTINVNEYLYDYNGSRYKIAATENRLKSVDKKADSICQKNCSSLSQQCCKVSVYYKKLLTNTSMNINAATPSAALKEFPLAKDDICYSSTSNLYSGMKKYIDNKKPVALYVTSSSGSQHWVTVVGYKGSGNKFSDFLILGSWSGDLCIGGSSASDVKGGLRKNASGFYKFKK